jgi:DNA ligase-1
LGEKFERTKKRNELSSLLSGFLTELQPAELAPASRIIIGRVFPEWDGRALNVSWKALMAIVDDMVDLPPATRGEASAGAVDGGEFVQHLLDQGRRTPTQPPPLTILGVYASFEEIAATAGRGSRAKKNALLQDLLERATAAEAKFLAKVVFQEMRHGVSEGILLDGIAKAAGLKTSIVRRANQMWGDVGQVALVAMTAGEEGLKNAAPVLFRPIKPMLAQTAEEVEEAFVRYGDRFALEYKLDGARVQIHAKGEEVRIYSRRLSDVTNSLPDVVAQVRQGLAAEEAILDGEAIAVDAGGRPLPFQHLMRRFRRRRDVVATVEEIPVQLHLFDAIYLDGNSLVDLPYADRWQALHGAAGSLKLMPRLLSPTPDKAQAFSDVAYQAGHEGVMAKDLSSPYAPGSRGKAWLKFKHVMSLDLVIVAADWGYGRRHGWLSNYHLAALDKATGEFKVVGKTFKGLTDVEFQAMTERLLALERSRQRGTVTIEPRLVVEVLFNEVQESRQYESGLALRFARIARLREDKGAQEADTLQTMRQLYEAQFEFKGRLSKPVDSQSPK